MDVNCSQVLTVDKAEAICKLHEIADYCLFGEGTWPADREGLPAVLRTVRELGLDEDVPDEFATSRCTALGSELQLHLMMAFIGAWEIEEVPYVLENYGYIDHTELEALWSNSCSWSETERKIKSMARRAYSQLRNRSQRVN